ncbi:hypothetical protein TWF281_010441 [Arthrobotrys megalospora]
MNPHRAQYEMTRLQTGTPGSFTMKSEASIPLEIPAVQSQPPAAEDSSENASITEIDKQKKLQRRIDWMILPPLTICYFLLFTNRMNVQLIKSDNDSRRYSLGLKEFAIVQFLFTITYALPEPLWNVLLRRLGPKFWLAPALLLSGFLAVFCAVVDNWQGLAAVRFLMGLPLGALFPGCMYYITCWYPRRQLGRPVAIFYAGGAMGSSLANLLSSALVTMNQGGRSGSDWVCIIWGIITVVCAIVVFFFIPDFPDEDDKILRSEAEHDMFKRWYVATDSTRNISEHYRNNAWKQVFTDMKTLLFIFVRMSTVVARDGLTQRQKDNAKALAGKLFEPRKPSDAIITLLYVPPAALAVITTIYIGILSDKTRQRGYYIMCTSWFSITAFIIFVSTNSKDVELQYVAGFLGSVGTWAGGAISWVWMANNVEGLFKRAIMIGVNVGTGNLIGGLTLPAAITLEDEPLIGSGYLLGLSCLHFVAIVVTRWYLSSQNKEKQHQLQQGIRDQRDPNNVVEEEDKGDKSLDFEYIL